MSPSSEFADDYSASEPLVAPPLPLDLNVQLSVMMFLQYAIWGTWLPLLYPFLSKYRHFSNYQIASIFAVGALGAIVAPFIAGQVADRYFSTQRFLGISHLLGAVLSWQLCWLESFPAFLAFSLLYSLIYSPTLSLTNSLAFHHLPDRDRDFGRVRVWGTLGWIAAGITIGQWLFHRYFGSGDQAVLAGMADAFRLSAIFGLVMGVWCLVALPSTPPMRGKRRNASLEALGEICRQPLITLFLLAVPISCIHQFYFVHTAGFLDTFKSRTAEIINRIFGVGGGGLMTIGQMSELFVLALIPLVSKRVSRKAMLAVGIAAYGIRMLLFSYVEPISLALSVPPVAVLIPGIAMHGLAFGCFIFVAFMIVDEETTGDVRASAQSLFNLVIVGVGTIVGSFIAGATADWATHDNKMNYQQLFSVPFWAAVACLVLLAIFYPGGRSSRTASHEV